MGRMPSPAVFAISRFEAFSIMVSRSATAQLGWLLCTPSKCQLS